MANEPRQKDTAGKAMPSSVASTWLSIGALLLLAAMSAAFCWLPAQRLWNDHVVQGWPVVDGTVTSARIAWTRHSAIGKKSAWAGWCVSWDYSYEWQGGSHGGNVGDLTPSTLSAGCFVYREAAERAATRRAPGSTLPVRVDPNDRWHSIPGPVGPRARDMVAVVLGAIPAGLAIYLGCMGLRRSRRRA